LVQQPPQTYEPSNIKEALTGPNRDKWRAAIVEEMRSLRKNHTWDLVKRPKDREIVSCKWVFKVKSSGRHKARLVARGFSQVYGQDYFETYALVTQLTSIRVLLAVAARHRLHVHQMDVKTAFLYGDLDEEIYMDQPDGYIDDQELVCCLRKSLYGLKQAPCVWYKVMDVFFKRQGFEKSTCDLAVYIKKNGNTLLLVVAVYVDDLLIAGANMAEIDQLKEVLKQSFDMSDLGQVKNLLGMQIEHLEDGSLFLHQSRYIEDMLKKFGMHESKAVDTPMVARIVPSDLAFDQKEYQRITRSEMWPSLGC